MSGAKKEPDIGIVPKGVSINMTSETMYFDFGFVFLIASKYAGVVGSTCLAPSSDRTFVI